MSLDRITLAAFRNHAETRLDDTRALNLLIGENGAGKTNVLEAISLLAPGRGLRRAALSEMAGANLVGGGADGGFAVSARLATAAGPVQLGTAVESAAPGRRIVQVNGAGASAVSLGEWLAIGWLTPAMDRLFADSAGARRRYLDRLALALDPTHARHASRYEAALRERNRMLADAGEADTVWFSSLEGQMASAGAALAQGRARLVEVLAEELTGLPDQPFALPELHYQPGGPVDEVALVAELAANRARDKAAGRTLAGPHRDDLAVAMAGRGTPAEQCSTGEQKALLIAITLAHAALAARGRPSVLLLDEVAAHLDPVRRAALYDRLRASGAQVWLTGTEIAPFVEIAGEAAVWRVSGGRVERA